MFHRASVIRAFVSHHKLNILQFISSQSHNRITQRTPHSSLQISLDICLICADKPEVIISLEVLINHGFDLA